MMVLSNIPRLCEDSLITGSSYQRRMKKNVSNISWASHVAMMLYFKPFNTQDVLEKTKLNFSAKRYEIHGKKIDAALLSAMGSI